MPPSTCTLHHLPPKLDQGAALVPGDRSGMWLKEAEHFLFRGDFFAFQHTGTRLLDHPLHQREHLLHLREQACGLRVGVLAQGRDHLPALLHHLFGGLDELLIERFLLGFFVFPFAP